MAQEFEGIRLGDARLNERLRSIADKVTREPEKSFPQIYEDDAAGLEGLYRLANNAKHPPTLRKCLAGHAANTLARCEAAAEVIAAHDTTDFKFGGDIPRAGLGPVDGGGQGFYAHMTLAVSADPSHRPLGVLGASTWVRERLDEGEKGGSNKDRRWRQRRHSPEKESLRWKRQANEVERFAQGRTRIIHVADSECDDYDFFADLLSNGLRFVIRMKHDRCVAGESVSKLREALERAVVVTEREVPISERKINQDKKKRIPPKALATHPPRTGRMAKLQISAMRVTLVRPHHAIEKHRQPDTIELNVVRAFEIDPPEGEQPVEWILYTSEPVETAEQVGKVIDIYRARWRIEEYFKALKSGCAYQTRQLGSLPALLLALAIFIPIAWRLLLLRTIARDEPDAPGTAVLSPQQIEVLRASLKKTVLSPHPGVREVLLAIAALGGHQKHNGEPGWMTLGRGYEKLLLLEQGWRAALETVDERARATQGQRPPRLRSVES